MMKFHINESQGPNPNEAKHKPEQHQKRAVINTNAEAKLAFGEGNRALPIQKGRVAQRAPGRLPGAAGGRPHARPP